jgi:hypothetical protein
VTHTYTRTYIVVSRHWFSVVASVKCWWLNRRDRPKPARSMYRERYEVFDDLDMRKPRWKKRRTYTLADWGGQ